MIVSSSYKAKIRKALAVKHGRKREYTTVQMYEAIWEEALESLKALAGPKRFREQQGEIEFYLKGFVNSVIMDWNKEKE